MSNSIPDRWIKYDPIGAQIPGTRFIAIKVPLRDTVQSAVPAGKRLTTVELLKRIPKLGLIIDLTNTRRYYNTQDFTKEGIPHIQINVPGHHVPDKKLVDKFKLDVLSFLNRNTDNDKLIGVHCTHGVNRTGFMICHFMITELGKKPSEAIESFRLARGYGIERANYKDALYNIGNEKYREPETRTKNDGSVQEKRLSKKKQGRVDNNASPTSKKFKSYSESVRSSTSAVQLPLDSRENTRNWQERGPSTVDPYSRERNVYERRNYTERPIYNWRDHRPPTDHRERELYERRVYERTPRDRSRYKIDRNPISFIDGPGTSRAPRTRDAVNTSLETERKNCISKNVYTHTSQTETLPKLISNERPTQPELLS